jgi:hypothetical protein
MKCRECGAEIADDADGCVHCGAWFFRGGSRDPKPRSEGAQQSLGGGRSKGVRGLFGMLGSSKPEKHAAGPPPDDHGLFVSRLEGHLRRVEAVGDSYRLFVRRYLSGDVISTLSAFAANKMALTRSDRKEHSVCFTESPISYWVCTVPYSIPDAKKWFGRAYGGYSKLLEQAWNSDQFRSLQCEVLVHVVYGWTEKDAWVNMTIFPIGSDGFGISPILPVDLLTEAEKHP